MSIVLTFENVQELNEFLANNNNQQQTSINNDIHTHDLNKEEITYLKDRYEAEVFKSLRLKEELAAMREPISYEQVRIALRAFDDEVLNATSSSEWDSSLKFPWIKLIRSLTGLGLKDAKDVVLNALKFDEYVPTQKDTCKDDNDSYDCF